MRNNFRSRGSHSPSHNRFRKKNMPSAATTAEVLRAIYSFQQAQPEQVPTEVQPLEPTGSFSDFDISPQLQKNISIKGYDTPTPIQAKTIPSILQGRDLIGIANTGTGKTAAFLIPLIEKVMKDRSQKVLIVAPTRELAVQIQDEFKGFTHGFPIRSALCIGGVFIGRQKSELRQNPNFVIGTPGRIKDLIRERALVLTNFNNVVLDETDRMVDIGFIGDIKYFISLLPQNRQSLFFSATVSGKVKEILTTFVKNPITASAVQQSTAKNIQQDVIKLQPGYTKIDTLHDLLAQEEFNKVVVFGRTKWGIQKLANDLIKRGFRAGAIHGNKNQNQRQRVLDQFKRNEIQVLLATDVASRGLDIPDVSHVINYDLPASVEDYVHRIGRTGRADKKGVALTFVE